MGVAQIELTCSTSLSGMSDTICLRDFDISRQTGFMPDKPALKRLPEYYDPWENLICNLPLLNKEKDTRESVLALPVLEVNEQHLPDEESWRRAYVVLTFLGQSYIWVEGEKGLPGCVPKCIAIPWCSVSAHLDLPPVMTYACTTLYNWYLLDPTKGVQADNLAISVTCTGTRDEEWFYLIPLYIELEAAKILVIIQDIHKSTQTNDYKAIEEGLRNITSCILTITTLLNKMYDQCSPDVFYRAIRPFQAGSKGLDAFPDGIIYEGVDTTPKMYSGASAAQNSCIPTLDIFLGVKHKGETEEFLKLQRKHMPRLHRNYLEVLERRLSMKEYVANCNNRLVTEAYNEAVKHLITFRTQHIVLVTRYIIQPKSKLSQRMNESLETKGTGGSDFMVFLRLSRNETSDCVHD